MEGALKVPRGNVITYFVLDFSSFEAMFFGFGVMCIFFNTRKVDIRNEFLNINLDNQKISNGLGVW